MKAAENEKILIDWFSAMPQICQYMDVTTDRVQRSEETFHAEIYSK